MKLRSLARLVVPLMAVLATATCTQDGDTALITVTADASVQQYKLYVLEVGADADAGGARTIDIAPGSTPSWVAVPPGKDPGNGSFEIGLSFEKKATYWLVIIGAACDSGMCSASDLPPGHVAHQFFWADQIVVNGNQTMTARLETVMPQDDQDRDLWPSAMTWSHASEYSGVRANMLDCLDADTTVTVTEQVCGMTQKMITAAKVAPFDLVDAMPTKPICGYAAACDPGNVPMCTDRDKDGDPDDTDCAPDDPEVHHPILDTKCSAYDPYPQSANCCGYALAAADPAAMMSSTLTAGMDYSGAQGPNGMPFCHPMHCGTKNYDCSDTPVACKLDADCDGFAAGPQQLMNSLGNMCDKPSDPNPGPMPDCNDCDPMVHPGMTEICGNNRDDNCNGLIDEGCISCDLDGDGFQRDDKTHGCPDSTNNNKPVDCDDFDSGVYPMSLSTPVAIPFFTQNGHGVLDVCQFNGQPSQAGGPACALRQACHLTDPDWKLQDDGCTGMPGRGCPPSTCDADGDGFIPMAKATDPSCKSFIQMIGGVAVYDCDDTDGTSFPYAPPNCKDSKNHYHTCGSWGPDSVLCGQMFGSDSDGDGYPDQVDCKPNDPNIHPFALEICDNQDNDCDGLVDENNIDETGKPMVMGGKIDACNVSNNGACKPTQGICVCSHIKSTAWYDDSNLPTSRVACPQEDAKVDSSADPAPRCFFAIAPKPQSCAGNPANAVDDDCDGRVDAPDGKNAPYVGGNIPAFGMTCWPGAQGQCAAKKGGTVIGCIQPKTGQPPSNCFAAFKGGVPPTNTGVNPWWVCSTDGKNPIDTASTDCPHDELCNGFDDDCNGVLPASEQDKDNDQYLACGSQFCSSSAPQYCVSDVTGACQMTLGKNSQGKQLLGCGDCADNDPAVHPNAQDICDNVDNDCNPNTADGAQECGYTGTIMQGWTTPAEPSLPNCCGLQQPNQNGTRCRNWKNDPNNCNGCATSSTDTAHICSTLKANLCVNGGCSCGQTMGSPCGTHFYCDAGNNGGTCSTCNLDKYCTDACIDCTQNAQTPYCKNDGGSVCVQCNTDPDCGKITINGQACGASGCWCSDGSLGTTAHTCVQKLVNGSTCVADDECIGGHCYTAQVGKRCSSLTSDCTAMCAVLDVTGTQCVAETAGTDVKSECPKSPPSDGCQLTTCNGTTGTHACDKANNTPCHTPTTSCSGSVATYTETDWTCQTGTCTSKDVGCMGFVCGSATCLKSCTGDADCDTVHYCAGGKCLAKNTNGVACTAADQCTSGNCVDTYCCNTACSGACDNCGLTGSKGTCTVVTEGTAGQPACAGHLQCDGVNATCPSSCASDLDCASGYYCNASGSCVAQLNDGTACNLSTDCKSGSCRECVDFCVANNGVSGAGMCCNAACSVAGGNSCQSCLKATNGVADGTCANITTDTASIAGACSPYLCSGASSACPTSCTKDADCISGDYCNSSGKCVAQLSDGTACNLSTDCKVTGSCQECKDFCVPNNGTSGAGMCCNMQCSASAGNGCQSCLKATNGLADGTCALITVDTASVGNTCSPYLCGGVSASCPTSCTKDADCISGDYCNASGKCVAELADGTACNLTTDCKQSGSCQECKDFCVPNNGSDYSSGGMCCHTACSVSGGNACQSCLKATNGVSDGTCNNVTVDTASVGNACNPYLCSGGSSMCPTSCTKDADCATGDYCNASGKCVAELADGTACNLTTDCKVAGGCQECTNFCVPNNGTSGTGMCCHTACSVSGGNSCQSCLKATNGVADGTCDPILADTASVANACNPYLCGGASASCPSTCAKDADCISGDYCNSSGKCVTQLSTGSACNLTSDCKQSGSCQECQSGFCADGFCCKTACTAACVSCGLAGTQGTCTNVVQGIASPSGHPACPAASTATCEYGSCNGNGSCAALSGTQCSAASCTNCGSNCSTTPFGQAKSTSASQTCDGTTEGSCPTNTAACVGDFACQNGTTCLTSCTDDANCVSGFYCSGGACVAQLATGKTTCTANDQCQSWRCNTGTGKCVACLTNADCPTTAPLCNGTTYTCGACTGSSDCTMNNDGMNCNTMSGACSCNNSSQCSGNTRMPACDTTNSICACNTMTDLVCPVGQVCTATDGTGSCVWDVGQPCLSNSDCLFGCNTTAGLCGLAKGATCSKNSQCASNSCSMGTCG